ncbi:MAG: YihY/virulence factor BrkB family protein [Candidatus Saccharimonadales bacterium]
MAFDRLTNRIDRFQRSNKLTSFVYAVIKKYSEDNSSYQGALLTYYGVLSLFPLLVVLTSLAKLLFSGNSSVRQQLSQSITKYFPVVGDQIQRGIHDPGKTGLLLFFSLLATLYGSRGVANAMQFSLSKVWRIPKSKRPPFMQSLSRSFSIIVLGGLGLIVASVLSGYVIHLGHSVGLKILGTSLSLLIIWVTLIAVFKLSIAGDKKIADVWRGTVLAAIAIEILQLVGNVILAKEVSHLNTRYGVFGLFIGLMFWLYLQAEVIIYGAQVDAVRHYHLYPRRINEPNPRT